MSEERIRNKESEYLKRVEMDYLDYSSPAVVEALKRIKYRYAIKCKCGKYYFSDIQSRPCPLCLHNAGKKILSKRSIEIFKQSQSLFSDKQHLNNNFDKEYRGKKI